MSGDRPRSRPITRLLLVVLGMFFGLVPGIWAAVLPESFYGDFPAIRPAWVAVDGPFNEHLIRDVGAMFLALAVIALVAAITGSPGQARLAGLAWLVFSVIHFAYHVTHLRVYGPLDQWLNVVSQVASILVALAVVLIPAQRPAADRRAPGDAVLPDGMPGSSDR
ncbi:hypothetical protein [Nakamurella sp.]|uniref:hypothetical protein n=1 Tax=Nakamurella sp. TaxID=1869182 RepID=UPI003782DC91